MRHEDLLRLAELVKGASGIELSGAQLGSLGGALRRVDPALEPAHLLKCADPVRRADLLDRLVDEVTVNETYFMRHADELLSIDWPQLAANALAAGRRLRIWSAACSSGEEPYTLALMAAEALGGAGAPVDVLGTDISPTTLARAQRGVYGVRSMRLVSADHRERWFEGADRGSLRVGDQLRGLVRFQRHNLIPDGTPPAGETPFDLVICRNVLIYFHRDTVTRILRGLRTAVAPHGELVLGAADRLGTQDLSPARPAPAAPARRRRSSPAPARPRT
ncbi:MAG: methyltransferase, CheR-type, partial [Solirubrobacterales bacterium]|nr:methyltransferase, CheR-type [Solirubrobacterales bacterium]